MFNSNSKMVLLKSWIRYYFVMIYYYFLEACENLMLQWIENDDKCMHLLDVGKEQDIADIKYFRYYFVMIYYYLFFNIITFIKLF
jgi:hypothetical protein